MNWEAVSTIAEVFGFVALVISLVYVGVQTQQNTRASRSDARQRILDKMSEAQANFLATPENRAVLQQGLADNTSVPATDYSMFSQWLFIFGNNLYNAIRLRDEGVLDEEAFQYISNAFVGACCTKGGNGWFMEASKLLPPTLVTYVNAEIENRRATVPDIDALLHINEATEDHSPPS
jgi:hypothetical protein